MKIKKYIKKPIPVEIVKLTRENIEEVKNWIKENCDYRVDTNAFGNLIIQKKEKVIIATPKFHFIIKGTKGEFYIEESLKNYEIYKGDNNE